MPDYKSGKWAAEIISLQNTDGSWGNEFHSMAVLASTKNMTTEQAFRIQA